MAKTKTPAAASSASRIAALVDDLGGLHQQMEGFDLLKKRAEQTRKTLLELVGDFDAALPKRLEGTFYDAEISPRRMETRVASARSPSNSAWRSSWPSAR